MLIAYCAPALATRVVFGTSVQAPARRGHERALRHFTRFLRCARARIVSRGPGHGKSTSIELDREYQGTLRLFHAWNRADCIEYAVDFVGCFGFDQR